MKKIPSNTIDSCLTDPPYGLKLHFNKWDYQIPSVEIWQELFRILKPGAYILVACGTKTQHRMVVNIEDAGFEVRDVISWIYGTGYPKNLDIALKMFKNKKSEDEIEKWRGWGTQLKPATEFFTLCRKPFSENTTVDNLLKWNVGAINIDECRIPLSENEKILTNVRNQGCGKFPTNIIHDGSSEVVQYFPINTTGTKNSKQKSNMRGVPFKKGLEPNDETKAIAFREYSQVRDSVSRFFYCAKPSLLERGELNNHPSVKPLKLIEYLLKLITPPGGICIDPFGGSGSIAVSCILNDFKYISMEYKNEYFNIMKSRIETALNSKKNISTNKKTKKLKETKLF